MGSISGSVLVKCKVCGSIFYWSMDNWPFVDTEIIGTCDDCLNEKNHDIIDESYYPIRVVGKITFTEKGYKGYNIVMWREKSERPKNSKD